MLVLFPAVTPHLIEGPSTIEMIRNQTSEVKCEVGGYPPPAKTWFLNDTRYDATFMNDSFMQTADGNLILVDLQPHSFWSVVCQASNEHGIVTSAESTIRVHGMWKFLSQLGTKKLRLTWAKWNRLGCSRPTTFSEHVHTTL